jgi:NADH-quinone oxidoreductase subunit G
MPKCTIDGKEIEVPPGTNLLKAALDHGIDIQHFCWHPDLAIDGNCRTCMVEIEKMPKLQIACNTVITDGMVVHTNSPKAREAQRSALEFLLLNHPIDCPVCDQAGECYLQDYYMKYGLYDSKVELESKVRKRKVVDLGPIMLDQERCVLCSRCLRFEKEVTGTNSLEFAMRGDQVRIRSFEDRPITHEYALNLAEVCPVGALLNHDFRFKVRVWFLREHESVCPGCSTGCNEWVDEWDGAVPRVRPRRNPDVNKSWMCDPGRNLYRLIGVAPRLARARVRAGSSWEDVDLRDALDRVAAALKEAGSASAFLASPQGTNEDAYAFKALADAVGGRLDFRVGDPQTRVRERVDNVLQRADRNPNTQGCLDQGLGRDGVPAILDACRAGQVQVLVLQGTEILRVPDALDAVAKVPFVAVMATHEGAELERATVLLPTALWVEYEGTFTNYQRRVQRTKRAVPAPGEAQPRWELAAGLLARLGRPLGAAAAREVFALVAKMTPDYRSLDYRAIGFQGRALPLAEAAGPVQEARA